MTTLPPQPSSSPLSKWGPSGNPPPMRHIESMWHYSVPLSLYVDKAAKLKEQIPYSGKSFWYSPCFSSEGPTWRPSCTFAIYLCTGRPKSITIHPLVGGSDSENTKVQVSWLCSFLLTFPTPSGPQSSLLFFYKILILHQLFICGCLYLSQSVAEPLRRLYAPFCKYNCIICRVKDWCFFMGCVSTWTTYWMAIPSVSVPFPHSCISCTHAVFLIGKFMCGVMALLLPWGHCLALSGYRWWHLQVPHAQYSKSQVRLTLLILKWLPYFRSLSHHTDLFMCSPLSIADFQ